MTRPAQPLPDSLRNQTLSTAAARRLGLSADRARRADLHHPHHGVVVTGPPPRTIVDRAWALAHVLPEEAWFSHSTAAQLRALPLPRALEGGPLHVAVPRELRALRRQGVVGHQRDLADPAFERLMLPTSAGELVPLRVAAPGALALTVACQLSIADVVAVIDALRLVDDVGATEDIDRMLERSSRRAGASALRRAVALSASGVRSRAETHLRLTLAAAGLPEVDVAPPVRTPLGVLHPDLAWPQFGVLVEYEGERHRTDARQFASDLARFDAFTDAGWSAVRAVKNDLYSNSRRLVATLARRLRQRGWRPSRPPRPPHHPLALP
ncbi:MAG: hypothetical protein RJQ01_03735 [Microcella sp.]|uniref:hypothetical protein n=1 Tax=Microcella sp. TaxID=1913979 RepID=UPI003315568F